MPSGPATPGRTPDTEPGAARRARLALLALAAAFPVVMAPRVLFGDAPDAPLPRRPACSDVVVVTTGALGPPPAGDSALAVFDRRASRVPCVAPAGAPALSAASLWTGRYPGALGLVDVGAGGGTGTLEPGTWTLASAARATGARTGAFLEAPLATRTGLEGFETLVEEPGAARRAAEFVAAHPGERLVVWLHVERDLDGAFSKLARALAEAGRDGSATRVLCALDGDPDAPDAPLSVSLPGALYPGRRATGRTSLVDVAGLLRMLLKLPPPRAGEPPLQSRAEMLWTALRGGSVPVWAVVQTADEDVWLQGANRVRRPRDGGDPAVEARNGGTWTPVEDAERDALLAAALAALRPLE